MIYSSITLALKELRLKTSMCIFSTSNNANNMLHDYKEDADKCHKTATGEHI